VHDAVAVALEARPPGVLGLDVRPPARLLLADGLGRQPRRLVPLVGLA